MDESIAAQTVKLLALESGVIIVAMRFLRLFQRIVKSIPNLSMKMKCLGVSKRVYFMAYFFFNLITSEVSLSSTCWQKIS